MKSWNIEVFLLDEAGNQKPANCFTKVVYNLHPSFANPVQSACSPQFACSSAYLLTSLVRSFHRASIPLRE